MTSSKLAIIGALTAAALTAAAVYAGKNSSDDEIDAATLAKANVALDQAITANGGAAFRVPRVHRGTPLHS